MMYVRVRACVYARARRENKQGAVTSTSQNKGEKTGDVVTTGDRLEIIDRFAPPLVTALTSGDKPCL